MAVSRKCFCFLSALLLFFLFFLSWILISPPSPVPQRFNESTILWRENASDEFWSQRGEFLERICGQSRWREEYAAFHKTKGKHRSSRKLFNVALESGWTDRLVGSVTSLYWAILTERVFLEVTYGDLPSYSEALYSNWIDWEGFASNGIGEFEGAHFTFHDTRAYKHPEERERYFYERNASALAYFMNDERKSSYFCDKDLRTIPWLPTEQASSPRLFVTSNRGKTHCLLTNPHTREALQRMRLNQRSVYLCGFDFLFQPKQEVVTLARPYLNRLLAYDIRITVSIRVRGDGAFRGVALSDNEMERITAKFYACARDIETDAIKRAHLIVKERPVTTVWYVMSESSEVKRYVAKKWQSDRQIVTDNFVPIHPDCHDKNVTTCTKKDMHASAVVAMAQLFIASSSQFHVVTPGSGFGIQAAWLASQDDVNVWMGTSHCTMKNKVSMRALVRHWAGI